MNFSYKSVEKQTGNNLFDALVERELGVFGETIHVPAGHDSNHHISHPSLHTDHRHHFVRDLQALDKLEQTKQEQELQGHGRRVGISVFVVARRNGHISLLFIVGERLQQHVQIQIVSNPCFYRR